MNSTVKGPGFEMTREATMESNLEQITLAVWIRAETPRGLKTQYHKAELSLIKKMFIDYLREAKERQHISCLQAIAAYKDTGDDFFIKNAMPEFIRAYVKQTRYAHLKTEEKLLLYTS